MMPLALERDGDLAVLVLDAPPKNVMEGAFFAAFAALVRDVLPGLDARGLVVRGRGRHFSAGADVPRLKDRLAQPGAAAELAANAAAFGTLESLPFPVVAAVDGACLGSGLELALACGAVVATPSALLGAPESSFGLMPGCGGTVRLPSRVGAPAALDLVLTGRLLPADEALALGLVDAVVPRPDLFPAAARLVRGLATQGRTRP
jgi:enoyl-CoA hydratase/carnithine racemase